MTTLQEESSSKVDGKPLTKRQAEILAFIRENIVAEQRMPSFREMMLKFGIKSPNGIKCHLFALVKKKRITVDFDMARGIKLTGVRVVLEDA